MCANVLHMANTSTEVTIKDKLAENERWRERVVESEADYATPEWKRRALDSVGRERAALEYAARTSRAGEDAPLPTFRDVAFRQEWSGLFTEPERQAVIWQYREHLNLGGYMDLLFQAAGEADGANLDRLALAYPDLVEGIRRWRSESGFADRIRALLVGSD